MSKELDYGSQWKMNYCLDLFTISIYRSHTLNSLCFGFIGFYFDIDFLSDKVKE